MRLRVAPEFREYFRKLKQVFLYITDDCNLRCRHCLYKPNLMSPKEIKLETALALLAEFRELGALKLTFIGGEPTLYGSSDNHKPLLTAIRESKSMGYKQVILDTNGQFDAGLLAKQDFKRLDILSFSLDGHTPNINDMIRGKGTFETSVSNLKKAVELGYNVRVTTCVHRGNIGRHQDGSLLLESMIKFAAIVGVKKINFHPLFKMGVARDIWTGKTDISPQMWMEVYSEIRRNIDAEKYEIPVRIPQRFITQEEFESDSIYYGYCPVKIGERALIHPNGIIRVCALQIGTPHGIAEFDDHQVTWNSARTNELLDHSLNYPTPCTNQRKDFGNFVPLCISFKPRQDEFVWKRVRPIESVR